MAVAALITWIITALFGFTMLGIWLRNGGGGGEPASHFRPPMVFGHFLLAAGGLVLWIIYVVNDSDTLAWIAFIDLLVVATLGDILVFRWGKDRQAKTPAVGAESTATTLAEQRIPLPIVVLHGIFAVTTIVLVLLAALEVGE
jgi:manganese efflux pump family protein